jgi:hypothetical protein
MKTSIFEKENPMFVRAFVVLGTFLAVVSLAGEACIGGVSNTDISEGDRCNPSDSHNDCASGLVCTGQGGSPTIPFCPENYCCSVDGNGNINSTVPNCQPGCNGGAASICHANSDPGACALAGGASLEVAMAMDSDGGASPSSDAAPGDSALTEGGD